MHKVLERKPEKTWCAALAPRQKYAFEWIEGFFGVVSIVCLIGLLIGVFGIGRDTYKESNRSNQESVRVIGGIVLVVLVLNGIFTIT